MSDQHNLIVISIEPARGDDPPIILAHTIRGDRRQLVGFMPYLLVECSGCGATIVVVLDIEDRSGEDDVAEALVDAAITLARDMELHFWLCETRTEAQNAVRARGFKAVGVVRETEMLEGGGGRKETGRLVVRFERQGGVVKCHKRGCGT